VKVGAEDGGLDHLYDGVARRADDRPRPVFERGALAGIAIDEGLHHRGMTRSVSLFVVIVNLGRRVRRGE
jgi:hypothetical protein